MKLFARNKKLLVVAIGSAALLMPLYSNATTKPPAAKTGYEVDGRTSASVLAAKRSHQVSDQDKFGLGLYSGIFVIGLIIFFAEQLKNR